MVFSSNVFLFLFLPVFLGLYYLSGERYRNLLLLIASYVFYAWWDAWSASGAEGRVAPGLCARFPPRPQLPHSRLNTRVTSPPRRKLLNGSRSFFASSIFGSQR